MNTSQVTHRENAGINLFYLMLHIWISMIEIDL